MSVVEQQIRPAPWAGPLSAVGKRRGEYAPFDEPENYENMALETLSNDDTVAETITSPTRDRSISLPIIPGTGRREPLKASSVNLSRRIATSVLTDVKQTVHQGALNLSPEKIQELTLESESLPLRALTPNPEDLSPGAKYVEPVEKELGFHGAAALAHSPEELSQEGAITSIGENNITNTLAAEPSTNSAMHVLSTTRPKSSTRSFTTPLQKRNSLPENRKMKLSDTTSDPPRPDSSKNTRAMNGPQTATLLEAAHISSSQYTTNVPIPPSSMPTYLQLELSSDRPSPLYIHRSTSYDTPYESTQVKYERLLNFILLPPQLEQVLWFGTFACLDAWLYAFTLLPLRFIKAIGLFIEWTIRALSREAGDLARRILKGAGALWSRRFRRRKALLEKPVLTVHTGTLNIENETKVSSKLLSDFSISEADVNEAGQLRRGSMKRRRSSIHKYRKPRLERPPRFQASHKADILQGLLIILSCAILMRFDASRMYHSIRGQAAIKLYVIYNVLEVFDRLFSALGQDILECLFSSETLNRDAKGKIQLMRPLILFLSALLYCVVHSTALFYQVITLNVAVNSYSNALLTLLMSNQFVEIKGTVFKKIEKENLFQLTCADVVERFQLWLMLLVIALRNIVEVGGLSIILTDFTAPFNSAAPLNSTAKIFGMLPQSFTILPSLLPYQILGPFLLVLGSEAIVDWLKHAYITKFNATSPKVYGRFFDVLAKDYYSNAFSEQNIMRRLGLPVIPLACLFIRATLQTYHMFLATNVSFTPILTATTTIIPPTNISSLNPSPAHTASTPILLHLEKFIRQALGRSSFGGGTSTTPTTYTWTWTVDDAIALATTLAFFLVVYLLLLAFKLALGMALLGVARRRYKGMKAREQETVVEPGSRRLGGWGAVEVGDERRKVIYEGDSEGLKAMREREAKGRRKEEEGRLKGNRDFDGVERYRMVAKRIW